MFIEPEKHVVIGITKCNMQNTYDIDELIEEATDVEKNISFAGYTVVLVEQDDEQHLVGML